MEKNVESGRQKFAKHKKIILFIVRITNIFPKKVKMFFWNSFQKSNRKQSVLFRYILLKSLCKSIGDNVFIGRDIEIIQFDKLEIGENVSIHKGCYLDATGRNLNRKRCFNCP